MVVLSDDAVVEIHNRRIELFFSLLLLPGSHFFCSFLEVAIYAVEKAGCHSNRCGPNVAFRCVGYSMCSLHMWGWLNLR